MVDTIHSEEKEASFARARLGVVFALVNGVAHNVMGTLMAMLSGWLVMPELFTHSIVQDVMGVITIGYVSAWIVAIWLLRLPLGFYVLGKGRNITPVPDEIKIATINLPFRLGVTAMGIWIFFSGFIFWILSGEVDNPDKFFTIVVTTILYAAVNTSVLVFYHAEYNLQRYDTLAYSMANTRVSQLDGALGMPTYVRIVTLIFTIAIVPALYNWTVRFNGLANELFDLQILVVTISVAVMQGFMLLNSISGPIGRLSQRFEEYIDGQEARSPRIWRADAMGKLSEMFEILITHKTERDRIEAAMGRYTSRELVNAALRGHVELDGETLDAVIMFVDLRGFTQISENKVPHEVVAMLNAYFDAAVGAIVEYGGVPNKFIGDGIFAYWGIPFAEGVDCENAVQAAIALVERVGKIEIDGKQLRAGVGLHYGPVIAGSIGTEQKLEYTAIGDTVNSGSRIEALTKDRGVPILLSQAVYDLLSTRTQHQCEFVSEESLRGRIGETRLYTVSFD